MYVQEKNKILEALLFLENNPVNINKLGKTLNVTDEEVCSIIDELNSNYKKEGSIFFINHNNNQCELTIDDGFSKNILSPYLVKKKKLPKGLMETLMIIAYKQPITKIEVEFIRGINSNGYIKQLVKDKFIEEAGRKNTIGRPILYQTTPYFLQHFSLNDINELPPLEEIKQYDFLEN